MTGLGVSVKYNIISGFRYNAPSMPLSPLIRFGTSTWTYEGWQGQLYLKPYAKTTFARECLGEYCQYLYKGEPLFRTVGIFLWMTYPRNAKNRL